MIDFSEYLITEALTIVSADFGHDLSIFTPTGHFSKVAWQICLFYLLALVIIRLMVFLQCRLLSHSSHPPYRGGCNFLLFAIALGKCEQISNFSCISLQLFLFYFSGKIAKRKASLSCLVIRSGEFPLGNLY